MIKIIVNSDNEVDFEYPVWMSERQFEKFVSFMKEMFPDITVENVQEPKKEMKGHERGKEWTSPEILELFISDDTTQIEKNLAARGYKRNSMSINMKKAEVYPKFLEWARKEGIIITEKNLLDCVNQWNGYENLKNVNKPK